MYVRYSTHLALHHPPSSPLSKPTGWAALEMSVPVLVSFLISDERNKNERAENVENSVELNDHRIDFIIENDNDNTQQYARPFPPRKSRMPIKCPHSSSATSCLLTGIILQAA